MNYRDMIEQGRDEYVEGPAEAVCNACDEVLADHCPECESCNGAGGNCTNENHCSLAR